MLSLAWNCSYYLFTYIIFENQNKTAVSQVCSPNIHHYTIEYLPKEQHLQFTLYFELNNLLGSFLTLETIFVFTSS